MCTKSHIKIILGALAAIGLTSTAPAGNVRTPNGVAADLEIDRALGALRAPVPQVMPYPGSGEKGAPLWPLYKQEVAKGQTDFRPVVAPVEPRARRERTSSPKPQPPADPPPQPPPCTPNSPNWPNCLQQP